MSSHVLDLLNFDCQLHVGNCDTKEFVYEIVRLPPPRVNETKTKDGTNASETIGLLDQ